jgi:ankyrin repeat protein
MKMNMNELILNKDFRGIEQALAKNPALANEGIPYDETNTAKAHPLHRICDRIFSNLITDEEGVEIAKLFLKYGADINGNGLIEKQDTPLLAACSLHADQLAILYIEKGADMHHPGCHGGTALHWAAWTGRPVLVKRLVEKGSEINKLCIDFKATPLFWAIHGLKNEGYDSMNDCLEIVRTLLKAGADKSIPNSNGTTIFDLPGSEDVELKNLLSNS